MDAIRLSGSTPVELRVGDTLHDTDVETLSGTDYFRRTFDGTVALPPQDSGKFRLHLPNCDGRVFRRTLSTLRTGVVTPAGQWHYATDAAEYARQLDMLTPSKRAEESTPRPTRLQRTHHLLGHSADVLVGHRGDGLWRTFDSEGELRTWDLQTQRSMPQRFEPASAAALDATSLATGAESGVKVWSLETGKEAASFAFKGAEAKPWSLALRLSLLLSASELTILLQDLRCASPKRKFSVKPEYMSHSSRHWVENVVLIDDRLYCAVNKSRGAFGSKRSTQVLDVGTGKRIGTLPMWGNFINAEDRALVFKGENELHWHDLTSGLMSVIKPADDCAAPLAFHQSWLLSVYDNMCYLDRAVGET